MADLTLTHKDSKSYTVAVTEDDNITPIDLTDAILKFAVKKRLSDSNLNAVIFKTTYVASELLITDAVNGLAFLDIGIFDTSDDRAGQYRWAIEVNRRKAIVSAAGTFTATTGSSVLATTGIDFTALKVGDIIVPTGTFNTTDVSITAIDTTALTVTVDDYTGFITETFGHTTYRGDRKTPTGLTGCFTIAADPVS